ncbi:hypothetical protein ACFOLC_04540 [Lysobacter cavernae]|uniref:Lipoprotein n=1 Tax=Lysobacter cavernae TaxID=1685901 RepID=A0ABV7RNE2_9GAMM
MTTHARTALLPLALLLALNACSSTPATTAGEGLPSSIPHAADGSALTSPANAFFQNVAALCGHAYAGRIVADTPAPTTADPFAGKPLVMHVRECDKDVIRIPFFVGDDRSRTWLLRRTADGLRLKHDHRHQDGSEDAVTMYGGDSAAPGSARRQEFPVDAESKAMFDREGRSVSNSNVWAMEVEPGRRFVYELSRPGRLFRVEFDLTRPLPAPPPPWGSR